MDTYIEFMGKEYSIIKYSELFIKHFRGIEIRGDSDRFSIVNEDDGIDIIFSDRLICQAIHFFSGNYGKGNKFCGQLPMDLSFHQTRNEVNVKYGTPSYKGGGDGEANIFFGMIPSWDKYVFEKYTVHIQYNKTGMNIDLITLMSPSMESYLENI